MCEAQAVMDPKGLLGDAQNLYDEGEFVLAFRRYEQVLALDPGNADACAGEARVHDALVKKGDEDKWWHLFVVSREGPLYRKLNGIILPGAAFTSTPLSGIVDHLRRQSVRFDADPDPAARGVGMVLDGLLASKGSAVANPPADPRITVKLGRLSLLEAAYDVAIHAGWHVTVQEDGLHFGAGETPASEMKTREFGVPRNFVLRPSTVPAGDRVGNIPMPPPQVAREFLGLSGMSFPPGSDAIYLPTIQNLVVRNTPANLHRIKELPFPND